MEYMSKGVVVSGRLDDWDTEAIKRVQEVLERKGIEESAEDFLMRTQNRDTSTPEERKFAGFLKNRLLNELINNWQRSREELRSEGELPGFRR